MPRQSSPRNKNGAKRGNSGSRSRNMPVLDSGNTRTPPQASTTRKKAAPARPTGKRYRRVHPLKTAWYWLWARCKRAIIAAGVVVALIFAWIWITLPNIDNLGLVSKVPSIVVHAENGDIIGSYGDVYGEYIPFKDLPKSLVNAVMATEDRNFYHHFGLDPIGLLRAMVTNFRAGHMVQGGSTVTQQVAKNVFLTPERTLSRKIREMFLAFKLESRFSKQEIMTIYLNRVYLGAGTFGVDAAAHRYFDKSARDLTLGESAVLTGLLKAPSRYAPTSNATLSRKRAEQVLINMEDAGYLDQKQLDAGKLELTNLLGKKVQVARGAPYFTDWIADQIPDLIGNITQDLEVTTTLDAHAQALAEAALINVMDKRGEAMNANQAALLSMTPDGAIKAMVGGRAYNESQYNRTTQSKRQPGSAFKLFVYLTALEGGMTPNSSVEDKPIRIGKWSPQNYKNGYQGEMSLRSALAQSINTVAVYLSERFGRKNVIAMAERLGVTSDLKPDPSLALGSNELTLMELTGAYAHLAADGLSVQPYGILEIRNSEGRVLYRKDTPSRSAVLSSDVVGMMNSMLMGVVSGGTGTAARIGRDVAGKTGTTSDYKDAWFVGYSPDLVTGVWVGNDDAKPMKKVTGGTLPASIWHDYMQTELANVPARPLPVSNGGFSFSNMLPWHDDGGNAPTRPSQPGSNGEDFELGNSFWEKLSTSGKTEYEYPGQPQH